MDGIEAVVLFEVVRRLQIRRYDNDTPFLGCRLPFFFFNPSWFCYSTHNVWSNKTMTDPKKKGETKIPS